MSDGPVSGLTHGDYWRRLNLFCFCADVRGIRWLLWERAIEGFWEPFRADNWSVRGGFCVRGLVKSFESIKIKEEILIFITLKLLSFLTDFTESVILDMTDSA